MDGISTRLCKLHPRRCVARTGGFCEVRPAPLGFNAMQRAQLRRAKQTKPLQPSLATEACPAAVHFEIGGWVQRRSVERRLTDEKALTNFVILTSSSTKIPRDQEISGSGEWKVGVRPKTWDLECFLHFYDCSPRKQCDGKADIRRPRHS